MARQTGLITLQGTVGNITFYKSLDGHMVRSKGGVSARKIATHSAFERTRENIAEFGSAAKGAKLLRTSLRTTIINASDSRMIGRLTAQMLRALQGDTISFRGQRNITDGNVSLLEGFDFNQGAKLSATLAAPYTVTFTRTTGSVQLTIADFIPFQLLHAPAGTTHFRLQADAASVNFRDASTEDATATSGYLAYNNEATGALSLNISLPANSTHPVFIVLGIEFFQQVNGDKYALHDGAFNACGIIRVALPA